MQFQENLRNIKNTGLSNRSYTLNEAVSGAESLINIGSGTYSDSEPVMYQQSVSKFEITLDDNANTIAQIYDISYSKYSKFAESFPSKAMPIALDLRIESVGSNKAVIVAKSIVAVSETCFAPKHFVKHQQNPCYGDIAPFSSEEGYFAGGGDEELILQNFYLNPMCDHGCGNIQPCETGPSTAYEAVEAAINTNYSICNAPQSPDPDKVFAGFVNVQCEDVNISFHRAPCELDVLFSGTCVMGEALNCIYCSIYSEIGGQIPIPPGNHFVSINMGHDACLCDATNVCDYILPSSSWAIVCYGTPTFKKQKVFWEAPTDVALDDLETP